MTVRKFADQIVHSTPERGSHPRTLVLPLAEVDLEGYGSFPTP